MEFFISPTTLFLILCSTSTLGYDKEDEFCILNGSTEEGICIPVTGCPHALQQIQNGQKPQLCGIKNKIALVCCPSSTIKTKMMCAKYFWYDYLYGVDKNSTVKGNDALAREFPHMAALGFGEKNSTEWKCGGSLISDQYVLTAAHCVYSQELGNVRWVRLGDLNLFTSVDDADPKDFEVESYIRHPDYKPPSRYHDIALIKLNQRIKFSNYTKPICLETSSDVTSSIPVATGWGRSSFAGDANSHLQKIYLDHFTSDECNRIYSISPKRELPHGILYNTQLCVGGRNAERDTCQGDSGGPLQVKNEKYESIYNLIGVISFGRGCGIANIPGVYTRVSYYVPWIENIVWPNVTYPYI